MSEDQDERLGRLLREDAPPERDALFRLSVLERRERQRFQKRSLLLLAAAVASAAIFLAGFGLGVDLLASVAATVLCVAIIGAIVFSAPAVAQVIRRLREGRSAAEKS